MEYAIYRLTTRYIIADIISDMAPIMVGNRKQHGILNLQYN